MDINKELSPHSYYLHTRNKSEVPKETAPSFSNVDVVVIGGGITGCSTALHLAQKGLEVVVLEARFIGFGASGRSGGQVSVGYSMEQPELEQCVGTANAKKLWEHSIKAVQYTHTLVDKYKINCDLKRGHIYTADSVQKLRALMSWKQHLVDCYGAEFLHSLSESQIRDEIGTQAYKGGVYDSFSGHLHPLNYCLGLADAARKAGAKIYEQSPVTGVNRLQSGVVVDGDNFRVKARKVLYACNAYLGKLERKATRIIMPVSTYIIATEPLSDKVAKAIIKNDVSVADNNFVLNYYRLSADKRLLFGGMVSYSRATNKAVSSRMHQEMVRLFPQLSETELSFFWGGDVAITINRMPDIRRLDDRSWVSQGYSGHGMALSGYMGKLLSEAMTDAPDILQCFEKISHRNFPGGNLLRMPLLVLAMSYFRFKDALQHLKK